MSVPSEFSGESRSRSLRMMDPEGWGWGRPCGEFPVGQLEVVGVGGRVVLTRERRVSLDAALARAFASEWGVVPGAATAVGVADSVADRLTGSGLEDPVAGESGFSGSVPAVSEPIR